MKPIKTIFHAIVCNSIVCDVLVNKETVVDAVKYYSRLDPKCKIKVIKAQSVDELQKKLTGTIKLRKAVSDINKR